MKETHETYRLNELFPEGRCQLASCDQHERPTAGTRRMNHHENRVGWRKSQIVLHECYKFESVSDRVAKNRQTHSMKMLASPGAWRLALITAITYARIH